MLNAYPVLRHMIQRALLERAENPLPNEIASLMALFNVLDGFSAFLHNRAAPGWGNAIEVWFETFLAAHPREHPKPKHHYCLHLDDQQARLRHFLICFCLERKHKSYKTYAAANTRRLGFDKSITLQMLNEQVRDLESGPAVQPLTYLLRPSDHTGSLATFVGATEKLQVATNIRHRLQSFGVGDMVFLANDTSVVEIRLCLHVAPTPEKSSGFFVLAAPYRRRNGIYFPCATFALVRIEDVRAACIWCDFDGGRKVIRPPAMAYISD